MSDMKLIMEAWKRYVFENEDSDEAKESKENKAKSEEELAFTGLLTAMRVALQDEVKEVKVSSRLTTSAACLVGSGLNVIFR